MKYLIHMTIVKSCQKLPHVTLQKRKWISTSYSLSSFKHLILLSNATKLCYLNLRNWKSHSRTISKPSQIMVHVLKDHVDSTFILVTICKWSHMFTSNMTNSIKSEVTSGHQARGSERSSKSILWSLNWIKQHLPGLPCSSFSRPAAINNWYFQRTVYHTQKNTIITKLPQNYLDLFYNVKSDTKRTFFAI